VIRRIAVLALLACALAPVAAGAAEPRFSMAEIESELMCPTCQTRLDLSHSPAADRIRAFVEAKRAQGWTKQEVKDALVRDFGPAVLAAPPAEGFGLVAWLVPIALVAAGVAVLWRRRRPLAASTARVDPALDARVDAALRDLADGE
jgi:cytochrome c-type biogenesis protein CcmH